MRTTISLSLLALAGAAHAATESARAFIFANNHVDNPGASTLSPEEVRLVLAQRLGVSEYHKIGGASETAIDAIDRYGGLQQQVSSPNTINVDHQLVIVAEGWTPEMSLSIQEKWGPLRLAFEMSDPPTYAMTEKLVLDMIAQGTSPLPDRCSMREQLSPRDSTKPDCWHDSSKIMHLDMKKPDDKTFLHYQGLIQENVKSQLYDVLLVTVPESSRDGKSSRAYGTYDIPYMPENRRRDLAEEPMRGTENNAPTNVSAENLSTPNKVYPFAAAPSGIVPWCHASNDTCNTATKGCSGNGVCGLKYGTKDSGCYSCQCIPTFHETKAGGFVTIYWGGAACSKQDISIQFWLLAGFSILLMGIVGWAIGLMFSIGEEKLPGVIGAGVSGPKASR